MFFLFPRSLVHLERGRGGGWRLPGASRTIFSSFFPASRGRKTLCFPACVSPVLECYLYMPYLFIFLIIAVLKHAGLQDFEMHGKNRVTEFALMCLLSLSSSLSECWVDCLLLPCLLFYGWLSLSRL